MKKQIILLGVLAVSTSSMALERKYADDYTFESLPVNSKSAEGGLSAFGKEVAFSRNDSTYTLQMPAEDGKLADEFKAHEMLTALNYEGQFAYDKKNNSIIVSHDGELYEISLASGKSGKLVIDGLGGGRQDFGNGSSVAYRRWRYKLPKVTGLYNPNFSARGDKLYFSADFEGGQGGRDIWFTTRKSDGTWTAPVNVAQVNTPSNEDYPFVAGDSLLYFSSDRKDQLGGWNVYKRGLKGNSDAAMLAEGVNSNGNDYNFVGNASSVFVISDRDGNVDIYSPLQKEKPVLETPVDSVPQPVEEPKQEELPKQEETRKLVDHNLCIINFKFDKTEYNRNYDKEIREAVAYIKAHPAAVFEVQGHTDVRGGEAYNNDLSVRRSKAVYDHLVREGVDPKRLRQTGYGKTMLVVPNADSASKHLQNRRVIIKVVE